MPIKNKIKTITASWVSSLGIIILQAWRFLGPTFKQATGCSGSGPGREEAWTRWAARVSFTRYGIYFGGRATDHTHGLTVV
jgi:hypothetical protein